MDLGVRLRQLRQQHNFSLYDVERQVGLHFSTIAKYERNERQPGIDVLRDLAALYKVPLGALLTDVDELTELLTDQQRQWLQLLGGRPPLARLLQILAPLSDQQLLGLTAFLAEDRSNDSPEAADARENVVPGPPGRVKY